MTNTIFFKSEITLIITTAFRGLMIINNSNLMIFTKPSSKFSIGLIPLVLLVATAGHQSFVYGSNANNDEVNCFERGIIDGEDHPFSQRTYGSCGDDYYQGFIKGCISVEDNDRDTCESATDA